MMMREVEHIQHGHIGRTRIFFCEEVISWEVISWWVSADVRTANYFVQMRSERSSRRRRGLRLLLACTLFIAGGGRGCNAFVAGVTRHQVSLLFKLDSVFFCGMHLAIISKKA